jgi:membrane fusion protein (multidrug efflux system)
MATPATADAPVARRPEAPIPSGGDARPVRTGRRRWTAGRKRALALAALVVIVAAVLIYRHLGAWQSTDDAQIDGYVYPVSARVSGHVTRVAVDDNQYVEAGTVVLQLDTHDYEVAVADAKGALASAQANAAALRGSVPITSANTATQLASALADIENTTAGVAAAQRQVDAAQASLREAEANHVKAQDDVTRYQPLAAKDEIPQRQYTQALAGEKAAAAAVEMARASGAAAQQQVPQARARLAQAQAQLRFAETRPQQVSVQRSHADAADAEVEKAAAALQQAQLNLGYTTVVAPVSGIVGQRSAQPGQNVSPGQQLLTIVPLDDQNIWVTANFQETQLKLIRAGQPATISVDAYGRSYQGHVLSVAGASGSVYSLLPPENATGNYVKVVQRIPVKIVLEKGQDPEHLLRPGLSVVPKVRVR